MRADEFFTLPTHFPFRGAFNPAVPPWEWLPRIQEILAEPSRFTRTLPAKLPPGVIIEGAVSIHEGVKFPPYCVIQGPAWIGPGTEIRPGAYIRGNVIIGADCVIGNACEYKNCLLMDGVQTPHYNYVGDSILGNGAHLGAGVICANLRLDKKPVSVMTPERLCETGLRKLGALLGDGAEAGCNTTLQPGTILGKRAVVGPSLAFGGFLEAETIAIGRVEIRRLPRRD